MGGTLPFDLRQSDLISVQHLVALEMSLLTYALAG